MAEGNTLERFQELLSGYRRLVAYRAGFQVEQQARFAAGCDEARALVRQRLEALASEMLRWRARFGAPPPFDLFEALGISGRENRYTDLLSWLSQRPEGVGEAFVEALLSRAQPTSLLPDRRGALLRVRREVVTDDGRIDLVLEFEQLAVAVEAKVWSGEHDTPAENPQTVSYRDALARRLELAGCVKHVVTILLSPAGTPPMGEEAARLSFFHLAAATLDVLELPSTDEERVTIRLFASHVLQMAGCVVAGHPFWRIEEALRREQWPSWVIQESNRLAMLEVAMKEGST